MLRPVRRRAVSDDVFAQLRDEIVGGRIAPGALLPAERALCEAFGVNRSSVREALRRLEQARLVSIRHGATPRALDYRQHAGLDLLSDLLVTPAGLPDTHVLRSVLEMRSAIAPDVARLAALRADAGDHARLDAAVAGMAAAAGELVTLQALAAELWSHLVDAARNVAYRLAYNSLRTSYDQGRALFTHVLASEIGDVAGHRALVAAVSRGDSGEAEALARGLVRRGESAIGAALDALDAAKEKR